MPSENTVIFDPPADLGGVPRTPTRLRDPRQKWGYLLTRDRMFCVICFKEAQIDQAAHGPYPASDIPTRVWVRIANPTRDRNPINPHTRRAYFAETRRAFKAHVAEFHAEWLERIDWNHRV